MDPKGTHVLAAQAGGRAHLVNVSGEDDKGKVEKIYATQDPDYENDLSYDFGALFANRGVYLLFGNVRGCIMVWDRSSGDIVHGLHHGDGKFYCIDVLLMCLIKRHLQITLSQQLQ